MASVLENDDFNDNFSFEKYTDMYNYLNIIYKDPKVTSIELYTTLGDKLNYYSYITG